ncbi:hypothetical protein MBM_09345 [Drepanopeziza brunnea f. sp. 'multigermtubi' MB_m1]|uniref:Uncharacterized protein n=1 Tax=Marssonina brunnea f. sp. multigermtubi (strain MB_m1) TaxID=1072389 RepID=K1XJ15_MARBU|nr:uncharacterized protein MBM_09345 [Drepanopeziza brunnea f. sp. 'multigermtubi' MB_m1]EKD12479.1 hypothetical protein MBM_09345 [Drepanopeziza brunnea f. sp. 'multigermtubi' MB_m1]
MAPLQLFPSFIYLLTLLTTPLLARNSHRPPNTCPTITKFTTPTSCPPTTPSVCPQPDCILVSPITVPCGCPTTIPTSAVHCAAAPMPSFHVEREKDPVGFDAATTGTYTYSDCDSDTATATGFVQDNHGDGGAGVLDGRVRHICGARLRLARKESILDIKPDGAYEYRFEKQILFLNSQDLIGILRVAWPLGLTKSTHPPPPPVSSSVIETRKTKKERNPPTADLLLLPQFDPPRAYPLETNQFQLGSAPRKGVLA